MKEIIERDTPPEWQPDAESMNCFSCDAAFSLFNRVCLFYFFFFFSLKLLRSDTIAEIVDCYFVKHALQKLCPSQNLIMWSKEFAKNVSLLPALPCK